MREYVVQSGPLRTFDALFDPRFEKLRPVADYHTICITAKPVTQRIVMNALHRSSTQEIQFISSLFSKLASDARTIFGLRDITGGRTTELAKKLWNQDALVWSRTNYGQTEDELVLVQLKNFTTDFQFIQEFVPPQEGQVFCYLTASTFDIFKIYWDRACQNSLKAKDDRMRRDIMMLANEAKITLWEDPDGSFTLILHPRISDVDGVEQAITAAGQKAGMAITFAPGLFS